jgi:hypothetical protein
MDAQEIAKYDLAPMEEAVNTLSQFEVAWSSGRFGKTCGLERSRTLVRGYKGNEFCVSEEVL